jgi:hypothetical protein
VEEQDSGLGGLYDFLPEPDPEKDAAAKLAAESKKLSSPKLPPDDKTRVIFLDVDGVLLPTGSVEVIVIDGVTMPKRDSVKESDFSAQALGSLRRIVQETGAIIVLSSEWRRTEGLQVSISSVMRYYDCPSFKEITPIFTPKPELVKAYGPIVAWAERRTREIGKWLKEHPEVTAWVALDDLDFEMADAVRSAGTPWIKCRSVHTDDRACLTEANASEAISILLNPPPDPKVYMRPVDVVDDSSRGVLASTEDSAPERIRLG